MATVAELTAPYANVMLAPRPGPGICHRCLNPTDGYDRCYACEHGGNTLDAMLPISYSVDGEQLHHVLSAYKRGQGAWTERFVVALAAILWRFLEVHEPCLAGAAGVDRFDTVTTVPSSRTDRTAPHPLARIVSELVAPVRERHRPLLARTDAPADPHVFSVDRFAAEAAGNGGVRGRAVLVIDDTWTTGASAQRAAVALKRAGAASVAAVVVGRHVHRGWHDNDRRLRALARTPWEWTSCAICRPVLSERLSTA